MQFILKTAIVILIKFGSEIATKVDSLPCTTIKYGFNLISLKIVVRVVYTVKHVYSAVFTSITYVLKKLFTMTRCIRGFPLQLLGDTLARFLRG